MVSVDVYTTETLRPANLKDGINEAPLLGFFKSVLPPPVYVKNSTLFIFATPRERIACRAASMWTCVARVQGMARPGEPSRRTLRVPTCLRRHTAESMGAMRHLSSPFRSSSHPMMGMDSEPSGLHPSETESRDLPFTMKGDPEGSFSPLAAPRPFTRACGRATEIKTTRGWAFRRGTEIKTTRGWAFRRGTEIKTTRRWAFRRGTEIKTTRGWDLRRGAAASMAGREDHQDKRQQTEKTHLKQ